MLVSRLLGLTERQRERERERGEGRGFRSGLQHRGPRRCMLRAERVSAGCETARLHAAGIPRGRACERTYLISGWRKEKQKPIIN